MWIEVILVLIILALVIWIYLIGGWSLERKDIADEMRELEKENEALKETNEALRSGLSSSSDRISRPLSRVIRLSEDLIRVKEAGLGSKTSRKIIEDKYDGELGPQLVKEILSSVENVSSPMKRRLAHEIFVGDIGRDIMKSLKKGDSLSDAAVDAGVPLRVAKERVRLLKETGYLDSKMNLTDWGSEVIEL